MTAVDLGKIGIWTSYRPFGVERAGEAAKLVEQLGYSAWWIGGSPHAPAVRPVLAATSTLVAATGILNVWDNEPAETAAAVVEIRRGFPGRFMLGIGIGHREATTEYRTPLDTMRAFLDGLDASATPPPADERCLAALGPKMLDLARERAAGAHPYFVPVAHTRFARERLGPGPLLAPEQGVVLDEDPTAAKAKAREHLARYLQLPNYTNNLLRHGLTEDDLRDGGSDRLLEAIVVTGGVEAVAERIREHREAGADHVCLQVLGEGLLPLAQWRALAEGLRLTD
jgi:probable F420-dependent oxidoreductase